MSKREKGSKTAPPGLADGAIGELMERALALESPGEALSSFLDELRSLAPAAGAQFTTALARSGQERAIPLLAALAAWEDLAPAAVEALGWIKSQEAARRLLELSEDSPSREVRKAAGRALYRLRSLGFQVEARSPDRPPAAAPAAQARPRAWASTIDGLGSRFLFLSIPKPLGGSAFVFLLLNDREGIKEARVGHLEEDDAPARIRAVARDSGLPHVEIPVDYARHLVREGRQRTQAAGRALPTEYLVWKELIGEPEGDWQRPPVYQELNASQILLEPGLLEESARLMDLSELRNWRLETDQMLPYAQELERARRGTLVLTEVAQREREEKVLAKALEDLLGDDGLVRYKRRLEEMGYILFRTGREREAKWALAAAVALEQEPRPSRIHLPGSRTADFSLGDRAPLTRHPFFRRLLEESLERALEEVSRGRKVIIAG